MTSDALTAKVISTSQSLSIDPSLSLAAIPLSRALQAVVTKADRVVWPLYAGGIAWHILSDRRPSGPVQKSGKVYWIDDGSNPGPRLSEPNALVRIRLIPVWSPATFRIPTSNLARKIGRLLGYREFSNSPLLNGNDSGLFDSADSSALQAALGDENRRDLQIAVTMHRHGSYQESPIDSSDTYNRLFVETDNLYPVPSNIPVEDRFSMAAALADSAVVPVVFIEPREASLAASLTEQLFFPALASGKKRPIILSLVPSGPAIAFFRALEGLTLLCPVSIEDVAGALQWAVKRSTTAREPVLLVKPSGNPRLPRTVLKTDWEMGQGVVLKEKNEGKLATVLFVVPGYLGAEAIKAVNKLAKKGFSSTVLAMRFLFPVNVEILEEYAPKFDIVIVADGYRGTGGIRATLALSGWLDHDSSHRLFYLNVPTDGNKMAEEAERIHREDRFRKTVDDVKRDQWR